MPNYVPYLLLTIVSICIITTIALHKRKYIIFVLLLFIAGMIYVFEYVIMVLLDSYEYYPKVLPVRYYDNILGAIVSDLFFVPAISLWIAVYKLRAGWIALIVLSIGGISLWFERLNVYQWNWWSSYYTVVTMPIFFAISRIWTVNLKKRPVWFVTLLLYTFTCTATFMYVISVIGIHIFRGGIFADPYHDDLFLYPIVCMLIAVVFSSVVFWTSKLRWRIIAILLITVMNLPLIHFGLLKIFVPLWQYLLIHISCCSFVLWLAFIANRSLRREWIVE